MNPRVELPEMVFTPKTMMLVPDSDFPLEVKMLTPDPLQKVKRYLGGRGSS